MTQIKLSYFDVDGGRAEPIRIVLHEADIDFEDHRFPFSDFAEVRKTTPLGQVPTVSFNGEQVTQSNALLRYFGKAAGLYPVDPYQALLCDEAMDAAEDLSNHLSASFGLQGEALKSAREAFVAGPLPRYLGWFNEKLAQRGNYFADDGLTIADLKVYMVARWLASGMLDHVPKDCLQKMAPLLAAHCARMAEEPMVKAYYQHRAAQK